MIPYQTCFEHLPIILHTASDTSFVGDVAKPILGSFVGAGLAFIATKIHDAHRRRQENLAAGNKAIFALRKQLSDFLTYRLQTYKEIDARKNFPLWHMLYRTYKASDPHLIDATSVGFLFENNRHSALLWRLTQCDTKAQDLSDWRAFRHENIPDVHKEVARIRSEGFVDWDDIEAQIDERYVQVGHDLLKGSVVRARWDFDELIANVTSELRAAIVAELDRPLDRFLRRFPGLGRAFPLPPVLDLPPPKSSALASELPDLPQKVKDEMRMIEEKRQAGAASNQAPAASKERDA